MKIENTHTQLPTQLRETALDARTPAENKQQLERAAYKEVRRDQDFARDISSGPLKDLFERSEIQSAKNGREIRHVMGASKAKLIGEAPFDLSNPYAQFNSIVAVMNNRMRDGKASPEAMKTGLRYAQDALTTAINVENTLTTATTHTTADNAAAQQRVLRARTVSATMTIQVNAYIRKSK